MRKIRVLVVDDSVMFRTLLVKALNDDPAIEVVATASDAYGARDAIIEHKPDVMTLDVEMPGMSGIEFLRKLMPQYPLPTVVISALNKTVFDALEAGAVDFVNKPSGLNNAQLSQFMKRELGTKVKIASTVKVGKLKTPQAVSQNNSHIVDKSNIQVIAIGASTGGTEATCSVLKGLGGDLPPILITQHMPPGFTSMYAQRLNEQCQMVVKEARNGDLVVPGQALVAPGDVQMKLVKNPQGKLVVDCRGKDRVNGHCPSVDVLFDSVANICGSRSVGVILTGMGGDGAKGLLNMRNAGARTIGQDEASCVVYGMPKVAFDIGAVQHQVTLSAIPDKIYGLMR